ncbi:MAG TPA: NADH-quinone oxidoreductase subunit L [Thermoplasmata archaeon]|nr:NADH-quinone oxidoreductase subunit L [Thermoplasmata archaeon]
MFEYAWLIIVLPLLGFLISGLLGRYLGRHVGWVAVGTIGAAFGIALFLLVQVLQGGAIGAQPGPIPATAAGFEWVPNVRFDLLIDNLSAFMLALVSLLSTLIALYSIGYMAEEEGKPRYFAEICLFVAGMLGTVSADNFLQLLVFWEIMGLCSYLLIGFWYHKPEAASAAKKAFLVTRIGDVLFLFGVVAIYIVFGSMKFTDIQAGIAAKIGTPTFDVRMMTVIPLLLFGGAVGKSAQFPLHLWLPDAMEGPTPVSALIHAATMVKAGVYLVARSFIFLVPVDPATGLVIPGAVPWNAILVIGVIGGFTAFFAATMAVANYDIKRVLAFSTISQLAYMFLGLAAGAWLMASAGPEETGGYSAALFHLTNHAFFKALLFLAAGSVIHAVHTNDMREMGGLRKHMPITALTMLLGCLALSGIPPFSGFWSKDEILGVTFAMGATQSLFYALYALGILTAFLTAFYTFRLWFLTFSGTFRGHHEEHLHESPGVMTGPLAFLAVFTIGSGLFAFLVPGGWSNLIFYHVPLAESPLAGFTRMPDVALAGLSVAVALGGLGLAFLVYYRRTIPAERFTRGPAGARIDRLLLNRYGMDAAYNKLAQYGVMGVAGAVDWFDRHVIDGAVNGAARAVVTLGNLSDRFDRTVIDGAVNAFSLSTVRSSLTLRQRQTGRVQNYAAVVVLGLSLVILVVFIWRFVLPALGVK